MSKERLFTDKMYLVHKTTGKRFVLGWHARSGWMPDLLQTSGPLQNSGQEYVNLLSRFFHDTYNQKNCTLKNYDHFKIDSKEYTIEYQSDVEKS